MTRPIDADALRKEIRELPSENISYFYSDVIDREVVQALISEAPTVERPHGEWIRHIDDLYPEESTEECSVCHEEQRITGNDDNFCPNCGADMREGDSDA